MEKSKYKKIVFEYQLNPKRSDRTVVVLTGIPGIPKKYDFFDELVSCGFNIVYPRYEGTWESEGNFLERPPAEAIDELIQYLHTKAFLSNQANIAEDIFILGSSFGGYVALSLKDQDYIKKVCVMSPVVSYKHVNGIDTLHDHIQNQFPDAYRYDELDWEKMLNDELKSPIIEMSLNSNKIMLLAGKEDTQISVSDLKKFTEEKNISNFKEVKSKHMTISRIDDQVKSDIVSFFD